MKKAPRTIISFCIFTISFLVVNIFLFHFLLADDGFAQHIVFSEIRISGGTGKTMDEFVELYNPTSEEVEIEGWSIGKLTKTATLEEISILISVTSSLTIAPHGYLLIAHPAYEVVDAIQPDLLYEGGSLAKDNTVLLLDDEGAIMDMVGWGEAEQGETSSASNPPDKKSIERRPGALLGNGQDTDNNSVDWIVSSSAPQNSQSQPLPLSNELPGAVMQVTSSAQVGEEIVFDASASFDSDGDIIEYFWDFGDDSMATGTLATHIYERVGDFEVTLTVTDNIGASASVSFIIEVLPAPEEIFDVGVIEIPTTTTPTTSTEQAEDILIIINEFVPDPLEGDKEWIELANLLDTTSSLAGWTLSDEIGVIAEVTSTISPYGFLVVELASSKLNNSGDSIVLKNAAGEVMDSSSFVAMKAKGNSMAALVNNEQVLFAETSTPTKGLENVITSPPVPVTSPAGGSSGGNAVGNSVYPSGSIVMNELLPSPGEDQEEFIELYNTKGFSIDVTGWWIEDGSKTKTVLSGVIAANGFLIVEEPKGKLNNSGDSLVLFDSGNGVMDKITYGAWNDGNTADNAVTPGEGVALVRKGQDTGNDFVDFALTSVLTKGQANSIVFEEKKSTGTASSTIPTGMILSEIFPNPKGEDTEAEFIELLNTSSSTIDMSGWKIEDSAKKPYTINKGMVAAGAYIVFKRSATAIALNNTGSETVALMSPSGAVMDSVVYTGGTEEQSYARKDDNVWLWTSTVTAGKKNIFSGKAVSPVIVIDAETDSILGEKMVFDASETTDPDGEALLFVWDFGDGNTAEGDAVEHIFTSSGKFTVELLVTDASGNESTQSIAIIVSPKELFVGGSPDALDIATAVQISEIYPYPIDGKEEFIELVNVSDHDMDLSGFLLDDADGGSKPYILPSGTVVRAGEYTVFGKKQTSLALNNENDSVRLLLPSGERIQEVPYGKAEKDGSYMLHTTGQWLWTSTRTPGKANILTIAPAAKKAATKAVKGTKIKAVVKTTVEGAKDMDIGQQVLVTGLVAVEPGTFGSQYFYIVDTASSTVGLSGVQVYQHKKEFPELRVGDRVEVIGEISSVSGESRIKVSAKEFIKKIDYVGLPLITPLEVASVLGTGGGTFVQTAGEITEAKSSYFYIDDGTEELKVTLKPGTDINAQSVEAGQIVAVTGIVGKTKDGVQLLPRSQGDIVVESGSVRSEVEVGEDKNSEPGMRWQYVIGFGWVVLLAALFLVKKRRESLEK